LSSIKGDPAQYVSVDEQPVAFDNSSHQLPMHLLAPQRRWRWGQQHQQAEPTAGDGEPSRAFALSTETRLPKIDRMIPALERRKKFRTAVDAEQCDEMIAWRESRMAA
jgi:hypothetical protein